jgi:hypothetical protein
VVVELIIKKGGKEREKKGKRRRKEREVERKKEGEKVRRASIISNRLSQAM